MNSTAKGIVTIKRKELIDLLEIEGHVTSITFDDDTLTVEHQMSQEKPFKFSEK